MRFRHPSVLVAGFVLGLSSGAAHAQPRVVQQPGTERPSMFSPETYCRAPQKFASGACVTQSPGGLEDRGRFRRLRSDG